MRLMRRSAEGSLCVSHVLPMDKLGEYAVLSHTWLGNGKEVTYDDLICGSESSKPASLAKLQFCETQAARDGLQHFWVDTCCINKTSSGELNEAIASMFQLYRNAARCYVFLVDVKAEDQDWEEQFRYSRWFRRGWTLQELLAPASVEFFSSDQRRLGDKSSLQGLIHDITGISRKALCSRNLAEFNTDEKMRWVSDRDTTRPEDKAYCLIGIFDVSVPVLYGEGNRAWTRLKKAIDRKYGDDAELKKILRTLPAASEATYRPSAEHHKPTCLHNTRKHILGEISQWVEGYDQRSIFWLTGPAGTGKSTIARTIATMYDERGMLGGSFFFSKGSEDLRCIAKFVTTLATQLASRPILRKHIRKCTETEVDIADQSLRDQWDRLILRPLSKAYSAVEYTTIVLVVDALDECDDDIDIQNLIEVVGTSDTLREVRLRILVTSTTELHDRHVHNTKPKTGPPCIVSQLMKPHAEDYDLRLFLKDTLLAVKDGFVEGWPDAQSISDLANASGGLFLWVFLACQFVFRDKEHARERHSSLIDKHHTNPARSGEALDSVYSIILESFVRPDQCGEQEEDHYAFSRLVYGSAVLLYAPLSTIALAHILGISGFGVKDRLADLDTIIDVGFGMYDSIYLRHASFRDFILDDQRCTNPNFWIDEKETHEALRAGCITLMSRSLKKNICQFDYSATLSNDIDAEEVRRRIDPELQYACRHWASHLRQSQFEPQDHDEVHKFLQKHLLNWIEVMGLIGSGSEVDLVLRRYQGSISSAFQQQQTQFVADARRLVFLAQPFIADSPLQIHIAAQEIMPSLSKKRFRKFQRFLTKTTSALAASNSPIVQAKPVSINTVAFMHDNMHIVSLSGELSVRKLAMASQAEEWKPGISYVMPMTYAAVSSDGLLAAVGTEHGAVIVWDLGNKLVRFAFRSHSSCVASLLFSHDGSILASTSSESTIILWNMRTGRQLRKYDTRSSSTNAVLAFYDNKVFATGSSGDEINLWDVTYYLSQPRLNLGRRTVQINAAAFSPDGKRMITGSDDTTIRLWDIAAEEIYGILKGHTKMVTAVTFSRGASIIVSGSADMTVRVWEASSTTLVHTLQGHTAAISAIMFSPNGSVLASQSIDDDVRVWDKTASQMVSVLGSLETTGLAVSTKS